MISPKNIVSQVDSKHPDPKKEDIVAKQKTEEIPEPIKKQADEKPSPKPKIDVDENIWPNVLNELKNKYNTLYGIVRMAEPVFKDGDQLDLIFDFAFHKKQVSEPKNTQILSTVINDLTGQNYHISCYLSDKPRKEAEPEKITKPSNKDLDNINKIFGGGEVVD